MYIYAKGKNIPTYTFGELLVQGERNADSIVFCVDRYYNDEDLLNCRFCIRGLTEDGWLAEQTLFPAEAENNKLNIPWTVSGDFTTNAGILKLELRASREDQLIVKYNMPPVRVKETVNGMNEPLPDTAEQAVSAINDAAAEGLEQIQAKIDSFDVSTLQERLDNMDANIAVFLARPEVIPLKRSEYQALTVKKNALYVITEEDV